MHEWLERRLDLPAAGGGWLAVYAPALLVGGSALLRAAADMAPPYRGGVRLAAAALAAAALIDPLDLDYDVKALVEENLEMGGVGLVLLAVAACAGRVGGLRAREGPREETRQATPRERD